MPEEALPAEGEGGAAKPQAVERPSGDIAPTPKLNSAAEWPWRAAAEMEMTAAKVDAKADDAGGALTFERDMWECFDVLWRERVEPSQRLMEQVAEVLRRRAELERRYGESLMVLANEVDRDAERSSVETAVEAVLVNFKNRGEQSMELAEQIEEDIVSFFLGVIRQHREVSQHIRKDVQVILKFCNEKRQAHERAVKRYASRCAEAEASAQECLQSLAMKTVDRLQLAQKAMQLSKQARQAEYEYYASIDQANKAQALHEQHMPVVLAALQDMEEKRGKCLKDGLMKLAVYETSWLRNLQYDLDAVVKAGESVDAIQDVHLFIQRQQGQPSETTQRGVQLAPRAFWTLGKKAAPASKPQLEVQAAIRQIMDEELRPSVHSMFADGASAKSVEDLKESVEPVRAALGDPRRRAGFCEVLREEVLAGDSPGTDLDNAKGLNVAIGTLEALVPLVRAALDACEEQNDSWCGRDLMVFVNLVAAEADAGKKVSLLSRVYNHALWNKVTFWEDVLLIGLCEAHCAEAIWRRSLPAGSQFTQPAMTSFLQRFLGYMMAFGISLEQGRSAVLSTLRKNSTMLGSSVKAYANLLVQAYEAAAPSPAPIADTSGLRQPTRDTREVISEDGGGTGAAAGADPNVQPATTEVAGDDFEAVALGLTSNAGQPASNDADAGVDQEFSEEDGEPEDEALRELSETQPSADEVFT